MKGKELKKVKRNEKEMNGKEINNKCYKVQAFRRLKLKPVIACSGELFVQVEAVDGCSNGGCKRLTRPGQATAPRASGSLWLFMAS